jgi:hypothetical protein
VKAKLLIVLLSLTFLVVFPGLTLAQYGSISGRVTDEATGLPIMGAHIRAMGDTCHGGGCGDAVTDSAGFYMIQHLHQGTYLVFASAYGYESEAYPESVIVVAGQNTPNIDFALTPMSGANGSISGRVTDETTGLPLPMAHVLAYSDTVHTWGGEAWTDTAGYYLIQNLIATQYVVRVHKDGYVDEVYPESVIVVAGQNTPNIDFALTPVGGGTGSISGRVTDETTGLPLPMAHVLAYDSTFCAGDAWTDTAGYYLMQNLVAGQYMVAVHKTGYVDEVYPESVIVEEGQNTPDIDFALTPVGGGFGSISGRVTDEQTGHPIIMAEITIVGIYCVWYTDTAGYYFCGNLPPGAYIVNAHKEGYIPETYPDSVIVVAGENSPGIDFALTPIGEYGSISGRVTDEETGLPIIMAHLVAIGLDNWCYGEAWSDTGGYYMIPNLCAGIYQVNANKPGYVPETYPDSVVVVGGENTPDIDFALTPTGGEFGSISGRVTDEMTGLPLPMTHVWAYSDTVHTWAGEAWTDTAGYYLIQNLIAAQYVVGVHKDGYVDEVYPESVVVVAGQNTPNIDFALTPMGQPGSISGTVTDQVTGEPIRCAHVSAYGEFGHGQTGTDSLGHYTISGLYPGSYFVTAWAMHYYPQDYPDTVVVVEGQNSPNIDFALVPYGGPGAGIIAGGVFEDTTFLMPIPFAIVFAISPGGNWGFDLTDSIGAYQIQGLQTDDYYVYAFACGYIGEFYNGVYSWEEATLVTPNAYNINFYLGRCGSEGGSIAGVINSNGSPLEGACVYASVSGEAVGFARSSTDGGYVINGLIPGTYTVTASMVMYHDGAYPDPVWVMPGKVGGIDLNLPPVVVGDVTGEGSIDIADVIFLINYLYVGGPAPDPLMTGDPNCDGAVDIEDVIYILNYLFIQGPSPCNP